METTKWIYTTVRATRHHPAREDGKLYIIHTATAPPLRYSIMGLYDPEENLAEIFDEDRPHTGRIVEAIEEKHGQSPSVDYT